MTAAVTTTPPEVTYTPEDLLAMPEGKHYELIDGRLRETTMSLESSWIGSQLNKRISNFVDENQLGWVFEATASYQCFADPRKVYRPDVSFIERERVTKEMMHGHARVRPDLAAEVISPNDQANAVHQKIEDYLQAGVRLVWIIVPETKSVHIHRIDGTTAKVGAGQKLDGEDVVPGFQIASSELFPKV